MQRLCVGVSMVLSVWSTPAWSQTVLPSGATQTTAATAADGHVTVSIAPASSQGLSHNTYTEFNVPLAGVDLDNQAAGALTILNEVTGTGRTSLDGSLAVLGPTANVIVANPNGITVNGGRFVNTGAAALATGSVSFNGKLDPVITTGDGTLEIGAGGLASSLTELDLISKTIKIAGTLDNTNAHAGAKLRLAAGAAAVTLDGKRKPGETDAEWMTVSPSAATAAGFNVDVSSLGSLKAGSIKIAVTDAGAGVRLKGDGAAGAKDFSISATGEIEILDARLSAAQDVQVTGSKVKVESAGRQASMTSDLSGVYVEAFNGDIVLLGANVKGKQRILSTFASLGGVTLTASGAVTVKTNAGFKPQLESTGEALALVAGGALALSEATLRSVEDIRLSTDAGLSADKSTLDAGRDVRTVSAGTTAISQSAVKTGGDIHLDAASLALLSGTVQTELIAGGGVILRTVSGGIENSGALVEGLSASTRDPDSKGAVTIYSAADVTATSLDAQHLAVFFGRSGDLNIDAAGSVVSKTGRLFSNQAIWITAGGTFSNETELTGDGEMRRIQRSTGPSWRTLFLFPGYESSYSGNFGESRIAGEFGLVTGVGDVTISALRLINRAGQISGQNVSLTGTDGLTIESRATGKINFTQSCGFFSCSATGSSNAGVMAAAVNAGGTIKLASNGRIDNIAGRLIATDGITVTAPEFSSRSLYLPTVVLRPQGLFGGFQGTYGWVAMNYDGGFLDTGKGDIEIHTTSPTDISGTQLFAGSGKVVIDKRGTITEVPTTGAVARAPIGLASGSPAVMVRWAAAALLASALWLGPAMAASPADPGQDLLKEQARALKLRELLKSVPGADAGRSAPAANHGGGERCFDIARITVEGITLLKAGEIEPVVAPHRGTCMDSKSVQTLMQGITNLYAVKGFITSRVYVPKQNLNEGDLKLLMVEGRIERIELKQVRKGEKEVIEGPQSKVATAFPDGNWGVFQSARHRAGARPGEPAAVFEGHRRSGSGQDRRRQRRRRDRADPKTVARDRRCRQRRLGGDRHHPPAGQASSTTISSD